MPPDVRKDLKQHARTLAQELAQTEEFDTILTEILRVALDVDGADSSDPSSSVEMELTTSQLNRRIPCLYSLHILEVRLAI